MAVGSHSGELHLAVRKTLDLHPKRQQSSCIRFSAFSSQRSLDAKPARHSLRRVTPTVVPVSANGVCNSAICFPPNTATKMRFYLDDYGCLKCGKTNVRYGSNAMCKPGVQQVKLKMLFAVKRRWQNRSPAADPPRTFQRASEARRLLADLIPKK